MMGLLTKADIEKEIKGAEAAVEAHKLGALINEIVLKAFKEELKKLNEK